MFFSDYARSCIWVLGKKPDGEPGPDHHPDLRAGREPRRSTCSPGPGGDLYYVDYGLNPNGGVGQGTAGVHRIVYTGSNGAPTARITANPASGPAPLAVDFSGSTSTDPDGDALTYRWDFDNNGTWDQTGGVTATHTYAAGTYTARLEVDDGHGHTATATAAAPGRQHRPDPRHRHPGDVADLGGRRRDQLQRRPRPTRSKGRCRPARSAGSVEIRHCPSGVCHTHPFGTFTGATGSFTAPPHEYPSHLLLTVTVTDSGGLTDSRTIQLDPKTVALTFASSPDRSGRDGRRGRPRCAVHRDVHPGLAGHGDRGAHHRHRRDRRGVQQLVGRLARSHALTPPAIATTYTATYTRPRFRPGRST